MVRSCAVGGLLLAMQGTLVGCASMPIDVLEVSAATLAAHPEQYSDRWVRIRGQVSYGFENCYVDGLVWYWPRDRTCYGLDSFLDPWSGAGSIVGQVSLRHGGHLGHPHWSLIRSRIYRGVALMD